MKVYYDPKADAIEIILRAGKVAETREIGREMYLDVDKNGEPLSLEILGVSERLPVEEFNHLTFDIANYPRDFGSLRDTSR